MITKNSVLPIPCGGCIQCRINDRRVRTHRMMLEASRFHNNSFLTLTYNNENLPKEFPNKKTGQLYADNSVNPSQSRKFLNTMRTDYKRKTGNSLSYYLCGEYGEKTQRPHYHVALFNFPTCINLAARKNLAKFEPCNCRNCSFLQKHWSYGHLFLGDLTQHSAQYVAGYVTKKLTTDTSEHNQNILQGRHPEFARMSKNPALGKIPILRHLERIKPYIQSPVDLPTVLTHNGKQWPIGRYLRQVMLKEMDWIDEEKTPIQAEVEATHKMLSMFHGKTLSDHQKNLIKGGLPEYALSILNEQYSKNIEEKEKLKQLNKKGF